MRFKIYPMDKNLHDIEDLFKKALEENGESPSDEVWENIDKKLDKDAVISIRKKYRHLQKAAILLLILATGLSLYLLTSRNEKKLVSSEDKNILNTTIKEKNNNNISKENNVRNNSNKVSSKSANGDLKGSDESQRLYLDSVLQIDNETVDRGALTDKDSRKEERIIEKNKKESLRKNYSKGLSRYSVSANTKQSTFNTKMKLKTELQDSLLKENNRSSIITFAASDSLQKLSVIQTTLLVDRINKKSTALMDPVLSYINKNVVSNNIKIKLSKRSLLSLTAFYSQNIGFYHFQNNSQINSNSAGFEQDENSISSSTLGALIDYSIHKHWSLQSGLIVSTTNIDLAPETIYAQPDNSGNIKFKINTSSGYAYILPSFNNNPAEGDSILSVSTTHTLQYLGIPLAIKYNISKGKFNLNARAGLVANLLTKGVVSTELEKGNDNDIETTNKIQGLKRFYLSGVAGVGIDYNVYKNWSLCFSPTFRFALNPINKDLPVKTFPNSFGFSLGVKMQL